MTKKDYSIDNYSLETFIPEALRSETSSAIIKNLFDRHLTKDESEKFFGYVGKKQTDPNDKTPFVKHYSEERRINNLQPLIEGKVGSETHIFSFDDILNRCKNLGIDTDKFNEWGASISFNLAPPIDFDKFVNYKNYFWIADVVTPVPTIFGNSSNAPDYVVMKKFRNDDVIKSDVVAIISDIAFITSFVQGTSYDGIIPQIGERYFLNANSSLSGVYLVTGAGPIRSEDFKYVKHLKFGAIANVKSGGAILVAPILAANQDTPLDVVTHLPSVTYYTSALNVSVISETEALDKHVPTCNDWQNHNYWVHADDLASQNIEPSTVVQAMRPIIEYDNTIELKSFTAITGERISQKKQSVCQPPLFSHFHFSGSYSDLSGSIFDYLDDENQRIDQFVQRRIARENVTQDFMFKQSLIEPDSGSILMYRNTSFKVTAQFDVVPEYSHSSLWQSGPQVSSPIHFTRQQFSGTTANVEILNIGVKQSDDTIFFTAESSKSIIFESKVLGKYDGPIIRSNVNPTVRSHKIIKDGVEDAVQTTELSARLTAGWTELMTSVYEGETVEIPNYVTFRFNAPVASSLEPADAHVTKIYTSEVPRYVYINNDGNIVDYYQGEAYDKRHAFETNASPVGAWWSPKQIKQNILHENRKTFAFGDLTGHFRSVISEQPLISGALNGKNNYRKLESINKGLGGIIKNYNAGYNLLISHLLQDDVTPITIMNFIESQYAQNLLSIGEFIKAEISELFKKHGASQITSIDASNDFVSRVYSEYVSYMQNRSDTEIFTDTTMPIPRWAATLPTLKITQMFKPGYEYNNDYGFKVLVHHDGHVSQPSDEDFDFNLNATLLQTGHNDVNGGFYEDSPTPPVSKPWFKGMMWFNPTTKALRVLNVTFEGNTQPTSAANGDFWLVNGEIKQFNGTAWTDYTGSLMNLWPKVSVSSLIDSVILHVENKIYESIMSDAHIYSMPSTLTKDEYEEELVRFAAKYDLDVYASDYSPSNAWSWNYKHADFSNVAPSLNGIARWSDLYVSYLGTNRPYIEPWKIIGLSSPAQIDLFKSQYATRFQDDNSKNLIPLFTTDKIASVTALVDVNVNVNLTIAGGHCPRVVDGVELMVNDLVLVANQNDQSENGIYIVQSPGSGSNGIWLKSEFGNTTNTPYIPNGLNPNLNKWIEIKNGQKWESTVWIVDSQTVNIDFEQYRYWLLNMWGYLKSTSGKKLCMNVYKEQMVPPYLAPSNFASGEALITSIPPGIDLTYAFGDNGPVEKAWKLSLEYRTAPARINFKNDPIKFLINTWGIAFSTHTLMSSNGIADKNQFDRSNNTKVSHTSIVLHGESRVGFNRHSENLPLIKGLSSNTRQTVKLTMVDHVLSGANRTTPIFKVAINDVNTNYFVVTTTSSDQYLSAHFKDRQNNITSYFMSTFGIIPDNFKIAEFGYGYQIGDCITFNVDLSGITNVVVTTLGIEQSLGLNQTYTHLMKYNNYDTSNSFNNIFLRKWDVRFGYRFDAIVKSEDVQIKSETVNIPKSLRTIVMKTNPRVNAFWIHALRIQLIKVGKYKPADTTSIQTGSNGAVTGMTSVVPDGDGSDWTFRIENYNAREPFINIDTFDLNGEYETFIPLNDQNRFRTWKRFTRVNGSERISLPKTVIGVQNVLNIIFGYLSQIESDGWRFNLGSIPNIDAELNRTITWHSEIEKFLSYVYTGMQEGQGHILNPFKTNVWFETDQGLISKFDDSKFIDFNSSQVACDVFGNVIPIQNIHVLRDGSISHVASSIPMFSLHVFVDTYEHVVLFDNYVDPTNKFTLIFDPYLGISVARLLFSGQRHLVRTGRPVLGGHYLNNGEMTQNVMAHIDSMQNYYDSAEVHNMPTVAKNSLALVGFNKKPYFDNIGISDASQFNFWQAMIKSKGTNLNIDAYLNNSLFRTAYLDEYWAYKIAEYGDARTEDYPELKINVADTENSYSTFRFHNGIDNVAYADSSDRIIDIDQLSDSRWSYTNQFDQRAISLFMKMLPSGKWTIDIEKIASLTPLQQEEFERLINKHFYFSAAKIGTINDVKNDLIAGRYEASAQVRNEEFDEGVNNTIYTVTLPEDYHHADLIIAKLYRKVGQSEILFSERPIINDDTEIFEFADAAWSAITSNGVDPSNVSGKKFTLNNLVFANRYFDGQSGYNTVSGLNPSLIVPGSLNTAIDFNIDTLISKINAKTIRIIPSVQMSSSSPLTDGNTFNYTVNYGGSNIEISRIELEFFAIDITKHNGTQLFDYQKNTMIEDIPFWHPQAKYVSSTPIGDIDFSTKFDPAKYSNVPTNINNDAYSFTAPWGKEHVGNVWWNKGVCEYSPYYDVKIYPQVQERISRWGKLSDFSKYEVLEWVESDISPNAYAKVSAAGTDPLIVGTPSQMQTFKRQRVWFGRPVAWSKVVTPARSASDVANGFSQSSQEADRVIISNTQPGETWVTFERGSINDYDIVAGTQMTGWGNPDFDESEVHKPFGQLIFGDKEMSIIGSDISIADIDAYIASGTPDIRTFFNSTKSRSSEYAKINNTAFKNNWIIKSVQISKVNDSKPIKAVGKIDFDLTGFVWNSRYLNKILNAPATAEKSDRPGLNDNYLVLNLVEINSSGRVIKESVTVEPSYPCPSINASNIEFVFFNTNIKLTLEINGSCDLITQSEASGQMFYAHPFVDIFGGRAAIGAIDRLHTSINSPALLDPYTNRDGEFYKFSKYDSTGTNVIGTDSGSVHIRNMISATVTVPFDSMLLSNVQRTNGVSARFEHERGFRVFEVPSQAQLDEDAPHPNNLWIPVIGDEVQLSKSIQTTDSIGNPITVYSTDQNDIDIYVAASKEALTVRGVNYAPFTSKWGSWVELVTRTFRKTVLGTNDYSITVQIPEVLQTKIESLTVYLNGIIQPSANYRLSGNTLTYFTDVKLKQGSELVVVYVPPMPSAPELEFDPTISEDVTKQNHFKNDYSYTAIPNRNADGVLIGFKYYFWVKDKNTAPAGKRQSVNQIMQGLRLAPTLFMTAQDILTSESFVTAGTVAGVNLTLPIRYQTITISGLNIFVKRNDTFKLRFVRDFSLRLNPNGLDLKNRHAEWVIIRPGMTNRLIPKKLWNKLVDSACAQDANGNTIPSAERIDYDARHATNTKYGFDNDQILCDSKILIETIKYIILNTKNVKLDVNGNSSQDFIDFLDRSNLDQYFYSSSKTRETLEMIWAKAKKRQVNEIFFACLEDIASQNYEMTDLFKTSRLSVYSLRTLNVIPQSGIVYDN